MGSRIVCTLVLTDPERAVVCTALRAAGWRGRVEYDPTLVTDALARFAEFDSLPMTAAQAHAVDDVLRWCNSTGQAKRWPKDDLRALQTVRARLARGEADRPTAEVEEVQTLW